MDLILPQHARVHGASSTSASNTATEPFTSDNVTLGSAGESSASRSSTVSLLFEKMPFEL